MQDSYNYFAGFDFHMEIVAETSYVFNRLNREIRDQLFLFHGIYFKLGTAMHISKIELENIKSHVSSTFEFSRGTTAITGENGAGKTTVIEAIAWTLFDLLEYKKEDFVRRGAKKGFVKITFESSLDEREYIVHRDSGAGYHVTDPRLNTRIADKKEEVFRFLWQHLGLEPGTDLKSLFRQAIGVPQGTFTAIFLDGATERKSAFDRLLKVEEYRQAAEKLRETSRHVDSLISGSRERIARFEGELTRSEIVESDLKNVTEQCAKLIAGIKGIEADVKIRHLRVNKFAEQERLVSDLRSGVERARSGHEKNEMVLQTAENSFGRSVDAAELIKSVRAEHERHLAVMEKFPEIDRERRQRDHLRDQIAKADSAIIKVKAEQRRLNIEIGNIEAVRREIESLRSKAAEQITIERDINGLRDRIAGARAADERIRSIDRELETKRELFRVNRSTDNDSKLREHILTDAEGLKAKKAILESEQQNLGEFERHLVKLQSTLKELADPAARIRVLEKTLLRENEMNTELREIEKNLERLDSEHQLLAEQLDEFKNIDERWLLLNKERESTINAHRVFIANAETASDLEKRKNDLDGAKAKLAVSTSELKKAEDALMAAGIDYDGIQHQVERNELLTAERRLAEAKANLNVAQLRREQLAAELGRFSEVRMSLQTEFKEKERLEKVSEATAFIRDTLKEAAPRVAKNYVYHVSLEANQMFREITGNGERTLKWTEDYSIVLEEDGYDRPFQSLSGGEQMSAALSVRLAILKQLSDIRIAFFDEPTTNMDAERRENFAEQISRIKHFDQLFVISHDDTFDNYVDNVLSIGD